MSGGKALTSRGLALVLFGSIAATVFTCTTESYLRLNK